MNNTMIITSNIIFHSVTMMQATHTHTRIYFLFLFPISIAEGAMGGRRGSPPGLDASSSQGPI